jgi:hypothetical protein
MKPAHWLIIITAVFFATLLYCKFAADTKREGLATGAAATSVVVTPTFTDSAAIPFGGTAGVKLSIVFSNLGASGAATAVKFSTTYTAAVPTAAPVTIGGVSLGTTVSGSGTQTRTATFNASAGPYYYRATVAATGCAEWTAATVVATLPAAVAAAIAAANNTISTVPLGSSIENRTVAAVAGVVSVAYQLTTTVTAGVLFKDGSAITATDGSVLILGSALESRYTLYICQALKARESYKDLISPIGTVETTFPSWTNPDTKSVYVYTPTGMSYTYGNSSGNGSVIITEWDGSKIEYLNDQTIIKTATNGTVTTTDANGVQTTTTQSPNYSAPTGTSNSDYPPGWLNTWTYSNSTWYQPVSNTNLTVKRWALIGTVWTAVPDAWTSTWSYTGGIWKDASGNVVSVGGSYSGAGATGATGTAGTPTLDSVIAQYYANLASGSGSTFDSSKYLLKTSIIPPVCPMCPLSGGGCSNCGGNGGAGTAGVAATGTSKTIEENKSLLDTLRSMRDSLSKAIDGDGTSSAPAPAAANTAAPTPASNTPAPATSSSSTPAPAAATGETVGSKLASMFSLKGGDNASGGTWNGGGAPPATGSGSIDSGPGGSGRSAAAPAAASSNVPVTAGTKDTTPPPLPPITHPSQLSPYSLYGAIGNSAGDFMPLGADFSSFGR